MGAPVSVTSLASRPELVGLELPSDFAEKLGQAVWGEKFNPHHDARGRFASGGGIDTNSSAFRGALAQNSLMIVPISKSDSATYQAFFLLPAGNAVVGKNLMTEAPSHNLFLKQAGVPVGVTKGYPLETALDAGWVRVSRRRSEVNYEVSKLGTTQRNLIKKHLRALQASDDLLVYIDVMGSRGVVSRAEYAFRKGEGLDKGIAGKTLRDDLWKSRIGWPISSEKTIAGNGHKSLEFFLDDQKFWEDLGIEVQKTMTPIFRKLLEAGYEVTEEHLHEIGFKFNPHHDARGRFGSGGGAAGGVAGGEWIHATTPEAARAILEDGIDVEKSASGGFWTSRTHEGERPAEVTVRVRVKDKEIMSVNDPRLYRVGSGLGGAKIAKAKSLGYKAIHVPANSPFKWGSSDWLIVLDHTAVSITKVTVGGEPIKALSETAKAIWWEDWLALRKQGAAQKAVGMILVNEEFDDKQLAPPAEAIDRLLEAESKAFATNWWNGLDQVTRERLRGAIRDNVQQGLSFTELTKSIEPLFGEQRALRIASTETTRLFAKGAMLSYQQAGVKMVQWRSAMDPWVCAHCKDLEGQSWPIGQNEEPPRHPACRCALMPYLEKRI